MAIVFNAEEVYRIGVGIERNGKRFYEGAAAAATDTDVKQFLVDLAQWESSHVELFENLLRILPMGTTSGELHDPDGEAQRYLKAAADSHVFLQVGLDIPAIVSGCRGVHDVLSMALRFEKDSVVLYTVMRDCVPEQLGKKSVDRLLHEEIQHVSLIQEKLRLLGSE